MGILRDAVMVSTTGPMMPPVDTPDQLAGEAIAQGLVDSTTSTGHATTGFWNSFFTTLSGAFSHH